MNLRLSAVLFCTALCSASAQTRTDSATVTRELNAAYAFKSAGATDSAIAHFRRARDASPSDPRARLELSYLLGSEPGTRISDIYAQALYQSRFSDGIVNGVARTGVVIEQSTQLTGYLVGRFTRDSRSTGGAQPVIYSDNYAAAGVGVRVRPGQSNAALYAEGAVAGDLVTTNRSRVRGDFRAGGYFAQSWMSWTDTKPGSFVNDAYADASYYSRYENGILYAQARPGIRIGKSSALATDVVAHLFLAADTRGDFYNNIAEAAAALRVMSAPSVGLSAYVEQVRGQYLRGHGSYGSGYWDTRISVIYGQYASHAP